MILNYRVEICRQCYFKRAKLCPYTDQYIQNAAKLCNIRKGGECSYYVPTPWLPKL